jgi:hypothetical protein
MEQLLIYLDIPIPWHKPLLLLMWLLVIWLIAKLVRAQITRSQVDSEAGYKAKKAVTFSAYVLFLIIVIMLYSTSLAGFTVALGVAGAELPLRCKRLLPVLPGGLPCCLGISIRQEIGFN